jgi:very-short-patch-repair endonuclease
LRFWNNEVMEDIEAVLQQIAQGLTPTLSHRERARVRGVRL